MAGSTFSALALGRSRTSIYGSMARFTQPMSNGEKPLAIVAGSGDSGEVVIAVEPSGEETWSLDLPGSAHVDSAMVARSQPWAALGMRGGLVYMVDLRAGDIMAQLAGAGQRSEVAWLDRDGEPPLLLVATGANLQALMVVPTTPADAQ